MPAEDQSSDQDGEHDDTTNYESSITKADNTSVEVIIDAGNGNVLAQDVSDH